MIYADALHACSCAGRRRKARHAHRRRSRHADRAGRGELLPLARRAPGHGARVLAAAALGADGVHAVRASCAWIAWRAGLRSPLRRASRSSCGSPRTSCGGATIRSARPRSWRSGWTSCARRIPKAQLHYHWVPYERISNNLKRAMVAAEDAKFVDHEGFDWDGIQNALEKNQKKGRVVAGGSTITQQLAKNLFLTPSRSYWRKAEEAVITRHARGDAAEAADPRDLPQRDRVGQRRVRRGGRGAALLRRVGGAASAGAGGAARGDGAQPALLRAQSGSAYLAGRVATILARMPSARFHSRGAERLPADRGTCAA